MDDEIQIKTGKIRTQVGVVAGKELRFLAHVPVCNKNTCLLRDHCPLKGTTNIREGDRCAMLNNYLTSLYMSWVSPRNGLGDVLTQIQLDRIGSHLMPLYLQLARFSLEATALDQTTYTNKQGTKMAYPHFAEMRSVMVQIRAELKDLQLEKLWEKKFPGQPKPTGAIDPEDVMSHGRVGAYEKMVEKAERRERERNNGK